MIRAILLFLCMTSLAYGDCFRAVQQVAHVQAVQAVAVPTVVEQVIVPEFSFLVGAQVRADALRRELQSLEQFQQFQQFRAFQAAQAQQQTPSAAPQQAQAQCNTASCSPMVQNQAAARSVVTSTCAKCHSGASPAGGIPLDGSVRISADVIARTVEMLTDPSTAPDKMQAVMSSIQPTDQGKLLAELSQLWK